MDWSLRYAPQLGYRQAEKKSFTHSVGNNNTWDHFAYAQKLGFAGLMSPWVAFFSAEEQDEYYRAVQGHDLEFSTLACLTRAEMSEPFFLASSKADQDALAARIAPITAAAVRLESSSIVSPIGAAEGLSYKEQFRIVADNFRRLADITGKDGVSLCIEPVSTLPNMLLKTTAENIDLVSQIDHPYVKLIFDTAHSWAFGEDVLKAFVDSYDLLIGFQIVDQPNRIEPGAGDGTIPFAKILAHAIRNGFTGLVELEYVCEDESVEGEQRGLERLAAIDREAKALAEQ